MLRFAVPLALALLVSGPVLGLAQVRYKDSEGVTHWVDSIDMVPEQYRAGAVGHPTSSPQPAQRDAEKQAEERRLFQQKLADWESAVTDCTEKVRSDAASNPDLATFTAVVSGPGQVKLGGSAPAQLSFDQCMRDAGQPMTRTTP